MFLIVKIDSVSNIELIKNCKNIEEVKDYYDKSTSSPYTNTLNKFVLEAVSLEKFISMNGMKNDNS